MDKIKLEFTVDQINVVLGSLANMPFGQVANLIGEIRQQAEPQAAAIQAAAEAKNEVTNEVSNA